MHGSHNTSLNGVMEVHVVVIVTVSDTFKVPAATILELLRDLPPVPVVGHPRQGGCTISCIDLENIESRRDTKDDSCQGLPEASPFNDSAVFINSFTLLEAKVSIRLHTWGLNERLELVTWMSRCSLDTEDSLNRLFTKNWVAETVSDVRELLVISPLDFVFAAFVVIVVGRCGAILQSLLEVYLLSLGEPGACGLSPSVVVLEEPVLQVSVEFLGVLSLVEAFRDV